jgi:Zn-dependent protease with chaperone function
MLIQALSDEDVQRLDDMSVFFCRSYAPSIVTELSNTPAVETMRLIIFEGEYLKKLSPEEVVAIILHEIGHIFNPHQDLQQREFNADDFAISKGYSKHIKSSLAKSIAKEPTTFDNPINRARITIMSVISSVYTNREF